MKTLTKPTAEDRAIVRLLVRAREDFQSQRIRMDNRVGRKADGEQQDIEERCFREDDIAGVLEISNNARAQEEQIEKRLGKVLKRFPIYNEWLVNVKGVGINMAAMIVAEFDIHRADTVSKLWQYAGLNPGQVLGKKRVQTDSPKTYQPQSGEVVKRGEDYVIVKTDQFIRGDRLTEGFVSPFNTKLRKALCGVLASAFIKAKAPYALQFYYPYKARLEQSDLKVFERAGKKSGEVCWKDAKPIHRHQAAIRFMIKRFLADLYNEWRPLEGLPVRPTYQEEYLGHKHAKAA